MPGCVERELGGGDALSPLNGGLDFLPAGFESRLGAAAGRVPCNGCVSEFCGRDDGAFFDWPDWFCSASSCCSARSQ